MSAGSSASSSGAVHAFAAALQRGRSGPGGLGGTQLSQVSCLAAPPAGVLRHAFPGLRAYSAASASQPAPSFSSQAGWQAAAGHGAGAAAAAEDSQLGGGSASQWPASASQWPDAEEPAQAPAPGASQAAWGCGEEGFSQATAFSLAPTRRFNAGGAALDDPSSALQRRDRFALPERDVLRVLHDVASALAHMHGLGLAHLDVKPANILAAYEGGPALCDVDGEWLPEATLRTGLDSLDALTQCLLEEAAGRERARLWAAAAAEAEAGAAGTAAADAAEGGAGADTHGAGAGQQQGGEGGISLSFCLAPAAATAALGGGQPMLNLSACSSACSPRGLPLPRMPRLNLSAAGDSSLRSAGCAAAAAGARQPYGDLPAEAAGAAAGVGPGGAWRCPGDVPLEALDLPPAAQLARLFTNPDAPAASEREEEAGGGGGAAGLPPAPPAGVRGPQLHRSHSLAEAGASGGGDLAASAAPRVSLARLARLGRVLYKLGDLGQAARTSSDAVNEGDSRYLSRELLEGDCSRLPASDVFALGLTLYELARGWGLPTGGEEYAALRRGELPAPHLSHLSLPVQALLGSMVREDADARPTAAQLLQHPHVRAAGACRDGVRWDMEGRLVAGDPLVAALSAQEYAGPWLAEGLLTPPHSGQQEQEQEAGQDGSSAQGSPPPGELTGGGAMHLGLSSAVSPAAAPQGSASGASAATDALAAGAGSCSGSELSTPLGHSGSAGERSSSSSSSSCGDGGGVPSAVPAIASTGGPAYSHLQPGLHLHLQRGGQHIDGVVERGRAGAARGAVSRLNLLSPPADGWTGEAGAGATLGAAGGGEAGAGSAGAGGLAHSLAALLRGGSCASDSSASSSSSGSSGAMPAPQHSLLYQLLALAAGQAGGGSGHAEHSAAGLALRALHSPSTATNSTASPPPGSAAGPQQHHQPAQRSEAPASHTVAPPTGTSSNACSPASSEGAEGSGMQLDGGTLGRVQSAGPGRLSVYPAASPPASDGSSSLDTAGAGAGASVCIPLAMLHGLAGELRDILGLHQQAQPSSLPKYEQPAATAQPLPQ
jgi:serine/threonine protein kinase